MRALVLLLCCVWTTPARGSSNACRAVDDDGRELARAEAASAVDCKWQLKREVKARHCRAGKSVRFTYERDGKPAGVLEVWCDP